jgi:oligopeptide/dipeptide ABC transporter ATP-binding protein
MDITNMKTVEGEKLLDVRNLNISFKTRKGEITAVEGLNLSVYNGELLALVGESGCGKSVTSLAIMNLIESPGIVKADSMILAGTELTKLNPAEIRNMRGTKMSMIFQDPLTSLNPLFTVGNQISEQFLTHVPNCSRAEARDRSIEMIRKTGIPGPEAVYKCFPHELSGGMQQRIMIAIAICCNPVLLIADEPTTALDVTIQAQILNLMRELIAGYNTSILFITHDLGVVAEMADRVIVMYTGQVVEEAEVNTLFHDPRHPYTRGLLHSTIKVQKVKSQLEPIAGTVPSLSDLPPGCRFNPRCQYATDECRQNKPELKEVDPKHYCRCFLSGKEER